MNVATLWTLFLTPIRYNFAKALYQQDLIRCPYIDILCLFLIICPKRVSNTIWLWFFPQTHIFVHKVGSVPHPYWWRYFEKRVMKKFIEKISIPLAVALIMFPQIIETMYSPALTSVKNSFRISENQAAQAMSIFFIAFAFGVVFWGRACDIIGRRPSTLLGLVVFILSAIFNPWINHTII